LVGNWIAKRAKAGVLPHEIGVFVRSAAQLDRARAAVMEAGPRDISLLSANDEQLAFFNFPPSSEMTAFCAGPFRTAQFL
jgi:hypothetical protein